MENAKKVLELNEKNSAKKALLEKVQVVELGKASDLTLGGSHNGYEGHRPTRSRS